VVDVAGRGRGHSCNLPSTPSYLCRTASTLISSLFCLWRGGRRKASPRCLATLALLLHNCARVTVPLAVFFCLPLSSPFCVWVALLRRTPARTGDGRAPVPRRAARALYHYAPLSSLPHFALLTFCAAVATTMQHQRALYRLPVPAAGWTRNGATFTLPRQLLALPYSRIACLCKRWTTGSLSFCYCTSPAPAGRGAETEQRLLCLSHFL